MITLEQIVIETAAVVRPPERLTVSQAAEKYRFLNNPGSYVGPWRNAMTPYLVEPMDELSNLDVTGEIFVGPAQCGKTDMLANWLSHSAICDPADMMVIQTSQTTARDFSKRRIDRLHRHTRPVGELLVQRRNYDNTFDKQYKSGMMLTLSWPTINELSGKPIPRLWLTDYDRMSQDVDGEGSPFDLARKRSTTFRSYGMTVAESSPGFVVENPKWVAKTPHEAPPTQGVLALYNRGDRRRWYWRCFHCQHAYEPDFSLFEWPDSVDPMEAADLVTLACPHCGGMIAHDPDEKLGTPGKFEMNQTGRWLKDGQVWTPEGEIVGRGPRSDIASFWLKGPAAAFMDWRTIVINYLKAEKEFQDTGTQEALKTTVMVDQGNAYIPRGIGSERLPEELKARAKDYGMRKVPTGARFLVAAVDVQKTRFVVQVMGVGPGGDFYIVDRFDIRKNMNRLDPDGHPEVVEPGAYLEDWRVLIPEVFEKTYPLSDGSERAMKVKMVVCDSAGSEGVTKNAYDFHRYLRDDPETKDHIKRFLLLKGVPNRAAPRVSLTYPDSERKDRFAGARGEIPVLFLNSNAIKDQAASMLDRKIPGGGMVHFASWLPDTWFTELVVEQRNAKGEWENPKNFRNESWDLLCYGIAATLSRNVRIEQIDWEAPPSWADEWDVNDLVFSLKSDTPFVPVRKNDYSALANLADTLA